MNSLPHMLRGRDAAVGDQVDRVGLQRPGDRAGAAAPLPRRPRQPGHRPQQRRHGRRAQPERGGPPEERPPGARPRSTSFSNARESPRSLIGPPPRRDAGRRSRDRPRAPAAPPGGDGPPRSGRGEEAHYPRPRRRTQATAHHGRGESGCARLPQSSRLPGLRDVQPRRVVARPRRPAVPRRPEMRDSSRPSAGAEPSSASEHMPYNRSLR